MHLSRGLGRDPATRRFNCWGTTRPARTLHVATAIALAMLLVAGQFVRADDLRPNILLILVDDFAESDLGSAPGSLHETPHIDQLIQSGLRFTHGYASAPICSASRAALLTGKTTARLQFEFVTKSEDGGQDLPTPLQAPRYPTNLSLAEVTIAERLSEAGYRTGYFGKWHLNQHYQRYLGWSPTHGPQQQGFETAVENFGSHPYSYWSDKSQRSFGPFKDGQFPRDRVTELAMQFLDNRSKSDQPFFLMVSHFFVHTPVHTQCRWLYDKYAAKLPEGIPNRTKRIQYAAFIETMDRYVGQLLSKLDELGLNDNTIVVFTSDNGGHPEYASNAPFRGSKWNLYEGGVRVPFVVRWPQHLPPGQKSTVPVVGYDLLPTLCAAAGVTDVLEDVDGQDIIKLLADPVAANDREIVWHFPFYHPETGYQSAKPEIGYADFRVSQTHPHSAIRKASHKLLYFYESADAELYSFDASSLESNERSATDPETAAMLQARLLDYLQSVNARRPIRKDQSK